MKALKYIVIAVLVFNGVWSLISWMTSSPEEEPQISYESTREITPFDEDAARGLDLQALTGLSKEIRSGQELERRLNEKGSINNLDLNADEKVDYIYVDEFGDTTNKIGYSLTIQPEEGQEQEVATVVVEKNGDRAEIQVIGNENIYGEEAIYNDWTRVSRERVPAASHGATYYPSYFSPRPLWVSPFYYGYYPSFFSPFPAIGFSFYSGNIGGFRSTTITRGPSQYQKSSSRQIQSPNKSKTADTGIKRSLKKPTSTQKQFQANAKKNYKGGGFGKKNAASPNKQLSSNSSKGLGSSNAGSASSPKSSKGFGSSSSKSSKSFGSNRSSGSSNSFGSSSKRSGSSFGSNRFRSSSSSSRSFSFGGK